MRALEKNVPKTGEILRQGFALILFLLLIFPAFGEGAEEQKFKIYEGEGEIIHVNPERKLLVVRHGEIKGYMEATTMGYLASSPDLIKGLKEGDRISFKIDGASDLIIEVGPVKPRAQIEPPRQREALPEKPTTRPATPRVIRDVLATAVIGREPREAPSPVPARIGRLYYFTEVVEAGAWTPLLHVWHWQNRKVGEVLLRVRGRRFRTWSNKVIPPSWTGEWRVEARTPEGTVLSSKTFVVSPAR